MGKIPPKETFYKGNPVLEFDLGRTKYGKDERDTFMLGVQKLREIDDHIDAVRVFLDKYGDYGKRGRSPYGED